MIHDSLPLGQKGQSSIYIIIFIIVIIFAVMLAGGGDSLFTGNEASSVVETQTSSGSALSPSPTASSSADWSVDYTLGDCLPGKSPTKSVEVTTTGTINGYLSLEIENTSGNWSVDATNSFVAPTETYNAKLDNASGYNTKNWRMRIFSGGTLSNSTWSGGTEKVISKTGLPTGCQ